MANITEALQDVEAIKYLKDTTSFSNFSLDEIWLMTGQLPKEDTTEISFFNFLQTLEAEKKTCLLQVESGNELGFLYFFSGKLVNALCDECEGQEAIYKVLCWDNVSIKVREMVRKEQDRVNSIIEPLSTLLTNAIKLKRAAKIPEKFKYPQPPLVDVVAREQELSDRSIIENKIENKIDECKKEIDMANVTDCLADLMKVDGALAASVVDIKSGMALGTIGSGINLEVAAAGNSEVVKAKLKTMHSLGLKERIEDILITLGQQYHLIRPLASAPNLFIYFVLNKAQSNLAMARYKLAELEGRLEV